MPRGRMAGAPGWGRQMRGCGYRMTVPRQAILSVLTDTEEHLSAEEIYLKVREVYPNVGLTTVYRTLDILTEMGLVVKFDFGDGRSRFELTEGRGHEDHHHHLVCTECKRVINYSDFMKEELEFLERAEKGLSKKYNFDIRNHIIQFYGVCEACRKAKK